MSSPIGLFDSGLGGLSVAVELMRQRPAEPLWVLGDTVHVPYGGRPLEEVREFALGLTGYLAAGGCRAVVMACNISSAVALTAAREQFTVPIFGMVDAGARAAVCGLGEEMSVGVLATEGTVRSGAYSRTLRALRPDLNTAEIACPGFVPLVESGKWDTPDAYEAARGYVRPLVERGFRTIILGCTHYPFLSEAIRQAFPYPVRLVDPASAVVEEMAAVLGPPASGPQAEHRFEATSEPDAFEQAGSRLLGCPIKVELCRVWSSDRAAVRPGVISAC